MLTDEVAAILAALGGLAGLAGLISALATARDSAKTTDLTALQTTINSLAEENTRLRTCIEVLEADRDADRREIATLSGQIQNLKCENGRLRRRIEELEAENARLRGQTIFQTAPPSYGTMCSGCTFHAMAS
jgi:septal ring factor EnvC (AmiA/AmiB activator)